MTDAAELLLRRDGGGSAQRTHLVRRIASTLDLPVTAFAISADTADAPTSTECAALLAAFSLIRDPQERASCLQFLEALAGR